MNITDQEIETVIDIMERAEFYDKSDILKERNKRKWIKKFPFMWDKKFKAYDTYFTLPNVHYYENFSEYQNSNLKLSNGLHDIWEIQIGGWSWAYAFVDENLYAEVRDEIRKFEDTIDYDYKDRWNDELYFHSDKAEANIAKLDKFLAELQEKIPEMQKKKRIEKLQADLDKLTK